MAEEKENGFPTWMLAIIMAVMLLIGGVAGYNLANYQLQKNLDDGITKCVGLGGVATLYKEGTEIRWRCMENDSP